MKELYLYNSLTNKRELFQAVNAPYVGMYVCGPTVYNEVHLGNCRTFTVFDIITRYLRHLGYKVRYVRNITDVGHLTDDSDDGEDKIAKKARLERTEPMEIVQRYTSRFHKVMEQLNNLPPDIEPTATGHIDEQIKMIESLLKKGLAYEVNGSIYFDIEAYNEDHEGSYGVLSGREMENLLSGQRVLDGQDDKRSKHDFALWKKAQDNHIMRWSSPWSDGFPGWHLECSAMSTKYLGRSFDIHGGGMDLQFPHHECEIAQSRGAYEREPVRYWLHSNMLTVNGQKMSKSLGNGVLPDELFNGTSSLFQKAYSPMTLRLAILQTHYRSTMDLSEHALQAAEKAYFKLMNTARNLHELKHQEHQEPQQSEDINEKLVKRIQQACEKAYKGMSEDLNTAMALASIFDLSKIINNLYNDVWQTSSIDKESFESMKHTYLAFVGDIFALKEEQKLETPEMLDILLPIYQSFKEQKAYDKVDMLRTSLKEKGIIIKDMKGAKVSWQYEE